MSVVELHVHAPGMLGPLPADAAALIDTTGSVGAVEELLRGAGATVGQPWAGYRSRMRLFGLADDDEGRGVASLSALGDGIDPGSDQFFLADPIQLIPDRDRLLVGVSGSEGIPPGTLKALMNELNVYLADDNLELLSGSSGQWYLRSSTRQSVRSLPLDRVLGRSMSECLPWGEDTATWMRVLNTVQMLLHDTQVNRDRLVQGRPVLNGLWPWGGGRLPEAPRATRWKRVFTETPLTRGLCLLARVRYGSLPDAEEIMTEAGSGPILLDLPDFPAVRDAETFADWQRALGAFGQDWAEPLSSAVSRGHLRRLVIHASGWRIERKRALIPYPRRRRRLRDWLMTR